MFLPGTTIYIQGLIIFIRLKKNKYTIYKGKTQNVNYFGVTRSEHLKQFRYLNVEENVVLIQYLCKNAFVIDFFFANILFF